MRTTDVLPSRRSRRRLTAYCGHACILVDLGPVDPRDQRQRPTDLFLIFVGANIVATTLQIGVVYRRSRWPPRSASFRPVRWAVRCSSRCWPGRLTPPSHPSSRHEPRFGYYGAQIVALILFLTNFVWIALNNVIAASITSRVVGDSAHQAIWAVGLGLVATFIVLGGPRFVGYADRVAVPLLACRAWSSRLRACARPGRAAACLARHRRSPARLRWVFGYQTSWLLMFGDYSRYSKSGRSAGVAVFAGLGPTALWFIPLGLMASHDRRVRRSRCDGAGTWPRWWGGTFVTLATLTTNFVNIYMSALALKEPQGRRRPIAWPCGSLAASARALVCCRRRGLDQMANFTLILAGLFVPVGGLLLAHFVIRRSADPLMRSCGSRGRASRCRQLVARWDVGVDCGRRHVLPRAIDRRWAPSLLCRWWSTCARTARLHRSTAP